MTTIKKTRVADIQFRPLNIEETKMLQKAINRGVSMSRFFLKESRKSVVLLHGQKVVFYPTDIHMVRKV